MVSPLFTDSGKLFPPDALRKNADDQSSFLYADAYSNAPDTGSMKMNANPSDSNKPYANDAQNSFLPDIVVSDGANAALDNGKDNPASAIVRDSVFDQPLTNNPDVLDRAAQAFTKDAESMLLYMAVMKADSARLTQISDPQTVLAMQQALAKALGPVKERMPINLQKLGVDPDTASQVAGILTTIDQALTKPLGQGDSASTEMTPITTKSQSNAIS